jgi:SAM-dependent methyltransferase
MPGLLSRNRQKFNAETRYTDKRRFFSAATYAQFEITLPIMLEHARGDLLDIGAGDIPYRPDLESRVRTYHTVDHELRVNEIDFAVDVQDMRGVIESERYDTALLIEVLEHVPNPFKAAGEVFRVLRPGGKVILSVPHLSRIHEAPYDFYRYTHYGLRHIFTECGFADIQITPRGGLSCFLGHQVSTALICLTWHVPILKQIVFTLNKWLLVWPCYWLDRHVDKQKLFAHGYVLVATKPPGAAT